VLYRTLCETEKASIIPGTYNKKNYSRKTSGEGEIREAVVQMKGYY